MEKRERIKSYPLVLAPPRDHRGGGSRSSPERGDGRRRAAPTQALIITDAQGRNRELQPKIPSPFLAQHIAQEVLGPEDHPSRHRAGSAAYLSVRDSTTEIMGAAGLFDLIV